MKKKHLVHTPGPWIIKDIDITHGWAIVQKGSPADKDSDESDEGGIVGSSEWLWLDIADAQLIATAPELLQACKTALDSTYRDGDLDHNEVIITVKALKVLEKAIAKAEGEL